MKCNLLSRILLLTVLASPLLDRTVRAEDSDKYLASAKKYADTVLEHGRDVYGKTRSPLFVDGMNIETLEPVRWQYEGEEWVLCNFAGQQPLMRLLDGLTALTADRRYRKAAEEAAGYAMEHLQSPSGLLYWGGHAAWDLQQDKPVGQYGSNIHELKTHQPYYELMWRVNSNATRRLAEAIWAGHILDWSLLDYNRHANTKKRVKPQWDHEFDEDVEVPFPAKGGNLSFVNVTPPLLRTGVALAVLAEDDNAGKWTLRLIERWQQGKYPRTGLCGGQLSYREHDRAKDALGHVHPEINEAQIVASYHQTGRYHNLPLAQMQAAEMMLNGSEAARRMAERFIEWASEDLKAYARACYDSKSGRFNGVMIDGTILQWKKAKSDYYVPSSFAPRGPDGFLLWGYAMAYRLTNDPEHWRMSRQICKRFELGDIGEADGRERDCNFKTSHSNWRTVYAMLELHRATSDQRFLKLAGRIADNLLEMQVENGLFPRRGRKWARTGDEIPLALLHLAAAFDGRSHLMPQPVLDSRFFHCEYHGPLADHQKKRADRRTYDHLVFYGN